MVERIKHRNIGTTNRKYLRQNSVELKQVQLLTVSVETDAIHLTSGTYV